MDRCMECTQPRCHCGAVCSHLRLLFRVKLPGFLVGLLCFLWPFQRGQHVPYITPDTCIIGFKAAGFLIGGERFLVTSKPLKKPALRHVVVSIPRTMLGLEANGSFRGSECLLVAREVSQDGRTVVIGQRGVDRFIVIKTIDWLVGGDDFLT